MMSALQVSRGQKIADLGCGRGGPGQWIAGITGAAVVGIDFSAVALDQARGLISWWDLHRRRIQCESVGKNFILEIVCRHRCS
jgi:cyclopropane fatty-acyl-phospholipid synthase-like methyltransferase